MEDDVFGTAIWALPTTNEPKSSSSNFIANETVDSNTLTVPPPSTSTTASSDETDFDQFSTPTETPFGDDDFGDFGDFENTEELIPGESVDFQPDDIGFGEEVVISDVPPILKPISPLQLDPMPERHELVRQINDLMDDIYGEYDMGGMTNEPLREREGLDQTLVTPESRGIYRTLLPSATPPMRPVNWTRSRTRRQHLISLGIPINLDEVLPRTADKLPTMKINTRPSSMPPQNGRGSSRPGSNASSRSGSPRPRRQASTAEQLRLGAKPELDDQLINTLLNLTPDTMNLSSLATLAGYRANLKLQTAKTSALLTHLLQARDALRQDSETYNMLIAELVGEAQKMKTGSKSKAPSRIGSGP